MTIPSWIIDTVFYQIFPDRFANGDLSNDPPNVLEWNTPPRIHGFHGGDLQGILKNLDYLSDLGINALYLNPIFLSPSTHRYNTVDYFQIDPRLGSMAEFSQLVRALHDRGMKLILDGVFNHTGRGFFAFNDILENQDHSPYKDWYTIHHFPVDAFSAGDAEDYLSWWKYKSLPKLNTRNPHVRRYIFNVARFWIEQGADGWRLDVPNEIDDDTFWAEFRQVVRQVNQDAYLLGEIWEADPRWVGEGHFDGLMNYPLRSIILDFINQKITAKEYTDKLVSLLSLYPQENGFAMYNLLGSHDVDRLWNSIGGDVNRIKLAYLALFTLPGVPAVYYGDEIGLTGGKDPDCRKAFTWQPDRWNKEVHEWVKKMIAIRKTQEPLKRGDFQRLQEEDRCQAFMRSSQDQRIIGIINASRDFRELHLDMDGYGINDGTNWIDLLGNDTWRVEGGKLTVRLQPISGRLLAVVS
ncbi:MAG: glycoside hydrolase family 13 protein [Anaerolineaceae bacterium]|nr:glycoside hydrolase family 13 protein [Anaerolineaceae bacterium]MBN2676481.1 glycoside hydrolase family 13 protein [Anaerolineaceae bacterium]